jgi:hypothetical protein
VFNVLLSMGLILYNRRKNILDRCKTFQSPLKVGQRCRFIFQIKALMRRGIPDTIMIVNKMINRCRKSSVDANVETVIVDERFQRDHLANRMGITKKIRMKPE